MNSFMSFLGVFNELLWLGIIDLGRFRERFFCEEREAIDSERVGLSTVENVYRLNGYECIECGF